MRRRLASLTAPAALLALLALLAPTAIGCGSDAAPNADRSERLATTRSAIIGGEPSTAEDDFALYLNHASKLSFTCGATLVAPNLVLTAKHCLFDFNDTQSFCDATGDPVPGSTGGEVTNPIPLTEIGFYVGGDAKKRAVDAAEPPRARAKVIIDDGSAKLCSHDLAYVLLDKSITDAPIAKMRLGKRLTEGSTVAVAGWGQVEDRTSTKIRQRRTGLVVQRVGAAVAPPNATGDLGPRSFETGPGPCTGDSGSPAFDLQTGTVLGVVARALDLDTADLVSPCRPATVRVVYMTAADFPRELRAAFAAAGAEPWLEGRAAAGFVRFKEECSADLECEGGRCIGASATTKGSCNIECKKPVGGKMLACPAGLVCGDGGTCESPPPAPPPVPAPTAPPGQDPAAEPEVASSSCATAPPRPDAPRGSSPWIVGLLGACIALARHRRIGARS